MEEKSFKKKERTKLIIASVTTLLLILTVVGYTYSYFELRETNTGVITGTVASLGIDLNVEKVAPSNDNGLVPQLDTAITSAVKGTQGNCIDDNNNTVCQVYKITVKNTSNTAINIDGIVELNAGSNTNLKWARIDSYTSGMTTKPNLIGSANSHTKTTLVKEDKFNATETKTYYIVVWISEIGGTQTDTGNFSGVVTFGTGLVESSNNDTSLALTTLTNLNLTSSLKTDTPDFSKVSYSTCDTSTDTTCENTVGIYAAEDDHGTSYYFRGDVENNYVKFGKNTSNQDMYWRIIRINGDGTIRMIYDGTSAHENGESSTDRRITTSAFKSSPYNDNTYVGYMYGTAGVTATGETAYNQTHSNQTDSTIKTYIEDTWYAQNIKNTTYEQYIADAIYCNDRSPYIGTGIGTTETHYAPGQRVQYNTIPEPTLKCERQEDRFTYNESVNGVLGNDKLEAPVGLITVDEAALAGAYNTINNNKYYLYTGSIYWTMSPCCFFGSGALEYRVTDSGRILGDSVEVTFYGVRVVITLKSDAIKYGTGVIADEFRISA